MKRSILLLPLALLSACLVPEQYLGVELQAVGDSGVTGVAEFIDYDLKGGIENVAYWVNVKGTTLGAKELTAKLVNGTCDAPGSIVTPLPIVEVNGSEATRNNSLGWADSLDKLIASPYAVVVKRTDSEVVLACGNVPDHISERW